MGRAEEEAQRRPGGQRWRACGRGLLDSVLGGRADYLDVDAMRASDAALLARRRGDGLNVPADAAGAVVDGEPVCGRDLAGFVDELHVALGPDGELPCLGVVGDLEPYGAAELLRDHCAAGDHASAQFVDAGSVAEPVGFVDGEHT
ncbi:MAG: hypothetical protein ACTHX2_00725 [Microbacterium sp.]